MIKPLLKDDEFLRDVRAARPSEKAVHIWWLGQSGFLVRYGNRFLLLDPYLSDSLTSKYAATDKPHVRMTERVIDPARLEFVDVVTSSHNHTDHLDADTLLALMGANPAMKLVTGEANRAFAAERLSVDPAWIVGVDAGQTASVAGFLISGVPAAHNDLERDEQGRCKYLGYVVRAGDRLIYHSGDTVWREEILAHLRRFPRIDVALLPINGNAPERRVAGNLDGQQAARLAKEIGAGVVIPCHYEMFEFNTASPAAFESECHRIGQSFRTLRAGERLST
jgi:L-ascorbate metabolism protein UlaG (beta-lactamase superfamily)